jgi:hypothetical protein
MIVVEFQVLFYETKVLLKIRPFFSYTIPMLLQEVAKLTVSADKQTSIETL